MKELIEKIKQWGIDRGIDKADPLMQTTKTLEECIELQQAILKNDKEEIKDAIGDIFVTIVMLSLQDKDIELEFPVVYSKSGLFFISRSLINQVTYMQCEITNHSSYNHYIKSMIEHLVNVSRSCNLTLEECVQHAYNQIKDRKGKMINGLWVKEEE